jgi:hypothetical protein
MQNLLVSVSPLMGCEVDRVELIKDQRVGAYLLTYGQKGEGIILFIHNY